MAVGNPVKLIQRALHAVHAYLVFYFGLVVLGGLCLVWVPFALLFKMILPKAQATTLGCLAISHGFRLYLRLLQLLGACCFNLDALDPLALEDALILAPNHPSLLDAVMVVSRLPRAVCIMKGALMDNLFLGAGARLAGYICNNSMRVMAHSALSALQARRQLLMFPEGTRTTHYPVNPFMGGISLIACHAGVPVQTIFIETDSAFLSKGWPLFKRPPMPVTFTVRLGRRFEANIGAKALLTELEEYFQHELSLRPPLPGLTPTGAETPKY
jgi:1-acyl-sn-glycerol-3-phosphate acyltransferase